jgi:hypothetical protein
MPATPAKTVAPGRILYFACTGIAGRVKRISSSNTTRLRNRGHVRNDIMQSLSISTMPWQFLNGTLSRRSEFLAGLS